MLPACKKKLIKRGNNAWSVILIIVLIKSVFTALVKFFPVAYRFIAQAFNYVKQGIFFKPPGGFHRLIKMLQKHTVIAFHRHPDQADT